MKPPSVIIATDATERRAANADGVAHDELSANVSAPRLHARTKDNTLIRRNLMAEIAAQLSHIRDMQTWNSGGDVMLDIIELADGLTIVVGEETVSVYRSAEDFWSEAEEGGDHRSTVVLLRETGEPFDV